MQRTRKSSKALKDYVPLKNSLETLHDEIRVFHCLVKTQQKGLVTHPSPDSTNSNIKIQAYYTISFKLN
jgi:hypothetical protein